MRNPALGAPAQRPGLPGTRRQTPRPDRRLFAGPDSHRVLPPQPLSLDGATARARGSHWTCAWGKKGGEDRMDGLPFPPSAPGVAAGHPRARRRGNSETGTT